MPTSARALLLAVSFLTVSTGVLAPAAARRVTGAQEALVERELAGAVLAPATASRVGGAQKVFVGRELAVASTGATLAPATASRVGRAQEALVERELAVAGASAVLAPATASRVGGAQEALVERELAVAGASAAFPPATASRVGGVQEETLAVGSGSAFLAPATASRVGGVQEALAVRGRTSTGSGAVVAKESSPPLAIAGDERRRPGFSVEFVFVGRALGSAALAPPAVSSQSHSPSPPCDRTPDDLALHRTMAAGQGGRAPLAPGVIIGIVCGVVATVLGALAIAVCCYRARKRRAAASRRWVSPNELAHV